MEQISKNGSKPINILPWLSRMTLEVIGLAGTFPLPRNLSERPGLKNLVGFSYSFNALTQEYENNELHKAFSKILDTNQGMPIIPIIRGLVPALRFLVRLLPISDGPNSSALQPAHLDAESKSAKKTMDRIAHELLEQSKASMAESSGKGNAMDKNLLTLLLRANMASDLPENQRMSDDEVLARAYAISESDIALTSSFVRGPDIPRGRP
jgi:hypothetical protein